ncbi:MAG: sigma-70 family RNA polymerase sigma factor [Akkermansiaceae bacterium]|nr:sigma-70 family RNA polymerase sigma factor [Akkermansiaceae bacterium]
MSAPPSDHNQFPPTRWTLVRKAMARQDTNAFAALSSLCEIYYRPILAVIRSQGYALHEAEDLRQRFFAGLVNRRNLGVATEKGIKLRAFLLQQLKGFLIDHYRHTVAAKRDSRKNEFLDDPQGACPGDAMPQLDSGSPDRDYDRRWRKALVSECMRLLAVEWEENRRMDGNLLPFSEIGPMLGYSSDESQRDMAARLGIDRNLITRDLARLRERLGKIIREQVAQTLSDPSGEQIREELKELMLLE